MRNWWTLFSERLGATTSGVTCGRQFVLHCYNASLEIRKQSLVGCNQHQRGVTGEKLAMMLFTDLTIEMDNRRVRIMGKK